MMHLMFFDSTMLLLIPAVLLALWAQMKVKSTYARYSQMPVQSGLTGARVAQLILRDERVPVADPSVAVAGAGRMVNQGVKICAIPGVLTDNYDPRTRELHLSEDIYYGTSVAALGIAAHEVGHAIQHARMYAPLALRNVIYPTANIGTTLAWPLFFIGFLARMPGLIQAGIVFFSLAVVFTVLTLPVEFNASWRALRVLSNGNYLTTDELAGARRVLTAAALTYVAAALMSILQLIRMILISRDR